MNIVSLDKNNFDIFKEIKELQNIIEEAKEINKKFGNYIEYMINEALFNKNIIPFYVFQMVLCFLPIIHLALLYGEIKSIFSKIFK